MVDRCIMDELSMLSENYGLLMSAISQDYNEFTNLLAPDSPVKSDTKLHNLL